MNTECKDYWASGKIVFIQRSLAFDKDQLCTIQMKSWKKFNDKEIDELI